MSGRPRLAPIRVATRPNLATGHNARADAFRVSFCPSTSAQANGPGAVVSK